MEKYQDGKVSKAAEQSFRFEATAEIQEAAALSAASAMSKIAESAKAQLKKERAGSPRYNQLLSKVSAALSMQKLEYQNSEQEGAVDKRISNAVKVIVVTNVVSTRI
jgi:hypothetical protein